MLADVYAKRIKVACHQAIGRCGDMDILNRTPEFFDKELTKEEFEDKREQMDAFLRALRSEVEERFCDLEQDEDASSEERLRSQELELMALYLGHVAISTQPFAGAHENAIVFPAV